MINRSAVIVRPRKPYTNWALSLDDSGVAPSVEGEKAIYLIPEYGDDLEAIEMLSQCFDIIFEAELDGWHTDDSAWPKKRSFKMFREWFSFEFHSVVEDICGYPLVDEEYE